MRHVIQPLPVKPDIIGVFPPPAHSGVSLLAEHADRHEFRFKEDPTFSDALLKSLKHVVASADRTNKNLSHNLLQWHSLKEGAALSQKMHEKRKYDLIGWFRPDLYFVNSLQPFFAPVAAGDIFFSPHDAWGGLNDRYCYGSPDSMIERMRIFDFFVNQWPGLAERRLSENSSWTWNPEIVLASYMENLGINPRYTTTFGLRTRQYWERDYLVVPVRCGMETRAYPFSSEQQSLFESWMDVFSLLARLPFTRPHVPIGPKRAVPLLAVKIAERYMQNQMRRQALEYIFRHVRP